MKLSQIIPLIFLLILAPICQAEKIYTVSGKAIAGYDPVSYFRSNQAKKGDPNISHVWNNVTWLFTSVENRDAFAKGPELYQPQYGGFCAYAMSKGSLAGVDPEAWTIVNGKLYLNYSKSIRAVWQNKQDENITKANFNWQKLKQ